MECQGSTITSNRHVSVDETIEKNFLLKELPIDVVVSNLKVLIGIPKGGQFVLPANDGRLYLSSLPAECEIDSSIYERTFATAYKIFFKNDNEIRVDNENFNFIKDNYHNALSGFEEVMDYSKDQTTHEKIKGIYFPPEYNREMPFSVMLENLKVLSTCKIGDRLVMDGPHIKIDDRWCQFLRRPIAGGYQEKPLRDTFEKAFHTLDNQGRLKKQAAQIEAIYKEAIAGTKNIAQTYTERGKPESAERIYKILVDNGCSEKSGPKGQTHNVDLEAFLAGTDSQLPPRREETPVSESSTAPANVFNVNLRPIPKQQKKEEGASKSPSELEERIRNLRKTKPESAKAQKSVEPVGASIFGKRVSGFKLGRQDSSRKLIEKKKKEEELAAFKKEAEATLENQRKTKSPLVREKSLEDIFSGSKLLERACKQKKGLERSTSAILFKENNDKSQTKRKSITLGQKKIGRLTDMLRRHGKKRKEQEVQEITNDKIEDRPVEIPTPRPLAPQQMFFEEERKFLEENPWLEAFKTITSKRESHGGRSESDSDEEGSCELVEPSYL